MESTDTYRCYTCRGYFCVKLLYFVTTSLGLGVPVVE